MIRSAKKAPTDIVISPTIDISIENNIKQFKELSFDRNAYVSSVVAVPVATRQP
jgi:hypothetical protein